MVTDFKTVCSLRILSEKKEAIKAVRVSRSADPDRELLTGQYDTVGPIGLRVLNLEPYVTLSR